MSGYDPTDGCPDCGTITSTHATDCDYLANQAADAVTEAHTDDRPSWADKDWTGLTHTPCEALLPGHQHCRHGHVEDCTNPTGSGNCLPVYGPSAVAR